MSFHTGMQSLAAVALGAFVGYQAATAGASHKAVTARPSVKNLETGGASASLTNPCCNRRRDRGRLLALAARSRTGAVGSVQESKKPNILVIFGDDIGIPQISAYTQGLMGYRTP